MPKISGLTQATVFDSADELPIVDKSDTTQAATGTTKRVVLSGLASAIGAQNPEFTQDSTSAKAGFRHVDLMASIADAGNDTYTVDLATQGNGNYVFTVFVRATAVGGTRYKAAYQMDVDRAAGTLAGAELAAPVALGTVDPELAVTFANSSGDLLITVTNSAGAVINAIVAVSWTFIPHQAAPV